MRSGRLFEDLGDVSVVELDLRADLARRFRIFDDAAVSSAGPLETPARPDGDARGHQGTFFEELEGAGTLEEDAEAEAAMAAFLAAATLRAETSFSISGR